MTSAPCPWQRKLALLEKDLEKEKSIAEGTVLGELFFRTIELFFRSLSYFLCIVFTGNWKIFS